MLNALCHLKIFCPKSATELWRVGVIEQPLHHFLTPGALAQAQIRWLPNPGPFRFIADPFGIQHAGYFTIFVEALDYRTKRGEIHYYQYDSAWNLHQQGTALSTSFHLSYPTILRDGDAIYTLPEANKSGKLTLYRATHFPDQWEPVADLLNLPAVDASIIRHQNRWWMFYTLPGVNGRALRELHIAHADALTGPWTQHTANPVRDARDSARPGGLPFVHDGTLYLPVQDCVTGYGTALNFLRIDALTPEKFIAEPILHLSPEGLCDGYADGLHTLSGEGNITLVDVKRVDPSPMRRIINIQRRVRRILGF